MGQTRVVAGAGRHSAAEAGPVWAAGPLDAEAAKQQTVDNYVNLAVKENHYFSKYTHHNVKL